MTDHAPCRRVRCGMMAALLTGAMIIVAPAAQAEPSLQAGGLDAAFAAASAEADVYAAVSDGTRFVDTGDKWHDFFCLPEETTL